jgi:hypothetical protein
MLKGVWLHIEDHRAALGSFSLVAADWAGVPFMHHGQMPGSRGSGMASPEFCPVLCLFVTRAFSWQLMLNIGTVSTVSNCRRLVSLKLGCDV